MPRIEEQPALGPQFAAWSTAADVQPLYLSCVMGTSVTQIGQTY